MLRSVDGGGGSLRLCRDHAWAEPARWPEITQRLQWDETERARANSSAAAEPYVEPLTHAEKLAALQKLRAVQAGQVGERQPRAWAHELRAREEAGEPLTPAQRDAWRAALGSAARFTEEFQP